MKRMCWAMTESGLISPRICIRQPCYDIISYHSVS